MGIKKIVGTAALAAGVSVAGLGLAAPAQAATYGQPGIVNCQVIRSVPTAPGERRVTWECDYRTSLGLVIKDAVKFDRTKRTYERRG